MAIAIAGIIAGVFSLVINAGMEGWFFIKGQKSLLMETRSAMKRMVRDVRRTRDNTANSVLTFTSTRYRFIDVDDNTIDYQWVGNDLRVGNNVLLPNLANNGGLEFIYLDANGAAAVFAEDIRVVQITLIVEEGTNRTRLRSAASLRNRQ